MFRSSIFSSSTLRPLAGGPGAGTAKAAVLAILLVVGAEGAARVALAPIGAYWEYWTPAAAGKFEVYREQVRRGAVPGLVVVGDSTGARDIDPALLRDI